MKFVIIIAAAIAVSAASVIPDPAYGYKEGDRYFYFPGDGDGLWHLVDALEPVDEDFIRSFMRNPEDNQYWLYTRENPDTPQHLHIGDVKSIRHSNFDFKKTTVFLAHGWNGHGGNSMNSALIEAFLIDDDVNVIVLDWSRLANRGYTTAKRGTAAVGKGLGQFINWLNVLGLKYEKVHLVGFSLGGHIVGNAGRVTGGKVQRITALDPAGPLWSRDSDRLRPDDGVYVEVIHTSSMLGIQDASGDADFYPNGGTSMAGCWVSSCSHSRAWEYMASSVKHNHLLANECATQREMSRNRCNGETYPMGNSHLKKGGRSGIFRVNTGRNYPY